MNFRGLRYSFHLDSLVLAIACLISTGCTLVNHAAAPVLPEQHLLEAGQLEVHSDFKLQQSHRLITELVAQRRDLANLLGVECTLPGIRGSAKTFATR